MKPWLGSGLGLGLGLGWFPANNWANKYGPLSSNTVIISPLHKIHRKIFSRFSAFLPLPRVFFSSRIENLIRFFRFFRYVSLFCSANQPRGQLGEPKRESQLTTGGQLPGTVRIYMGSIHLTLLAKIQTGCVKLCWSLRIALI